MRACVSQADPAGAPVRSASSPRVWSSSPRDTREMMCTPRTYPPRSSHRRCRWESTCSRSPRGSRARADAPPPLSRRAARRWPSDGSAPLPSRPAGA
eukprot:scaffold28552_cov54-Phaeocystis_antarctica.AAC.2